MFAKVKIVSFFPRRTEPDHGGSVQWNQNDTRGFGPSPRPCGGAADGGRALCACLERDKKTDGVAWNGPATIRTPEAGLAAPWAGIGLPRPFPSIADRTLISAKPPNLPLVGAT